MPTDNLTPTESAILIVLLAEARTVSNKELDERFGLTLTGKSRVKLVDTLGYVEQAKDRRAFAYRLGEAGWARCREPLNFAKVRPLALGAALTVLMDAVQRDLERTGRSLAMMFAPDAASAEPTVAAPAAEPTVAVEPVAAPADLQEQIRLTYKQFAAEPGDWVNIADIREAFSAVSREDMDTALRELEQQRDVNITPQADENNLSERTRRAAVIIGRQHKHFIAIGV